MSKPDEVNDLGGGWRREVTHRKSGGPERGASRVVKLVGPDGRTQVVWHEAFDGAGRLRHRHVKYRREEPEGDDSDILDG